MCQLYICKKKKKMNIFSLFPYSAYSQVRDIGTLIINDKEL